MIYTTYDPTTGEIQATYTTPDDFLPADAIQGSYNSRNYYIQDGQAVAKPRDPSALLKYYFDYATKTWQVDLEKSAISLRDIRKQLLDQVDRVNPIRYASLTTEQQQELIAYRQALLDVPQQSGFPSQVEWPAKPAWL